MKKFLLSMAMMSSITTGFAQKTLVLYYSETGTTKTVAQELQKQLGADIESIEAEEPYTGIFQETISAHPDFSVADLHRPCMTA